MSVGLKRISMAMGFLAVGLTASALAQAPSAAPSPNQNQNQATADAVASALQASPALAGYRIEIQTRDGVIALRGAVATPAQKAEAITRARQVRGVAGVVDQLQVAGESRVVPVQYQVARGGNVPHFGGPVGGGYPGGGYPGAGYPGAPTYGGAGMGGPIVSEASMGGMNGMVTEGGIGGPAPEGMAGSVSAGHAAQPNLPNYSWPSYAPYPNFSAVGYPTAYPWQAWPNIAAPYPYPEVPLDWRAVTLRWDDGIWWLDFKKHYTRPFFTPYPFGLFAY